MSLIEISLLLQLTVLALGDDFYKLLDIGKHATDREIRKAFKSKALKYHPDKNIDDPDAQANFLKINRAYEVLKDEELRKKYDLYGEDGLDDSKWRGSHYQSWSYYHDNFGIYDDDPEIITLNKADFEASVVGSSDIWLINFYHPQCSHCHTLAPVWRQVSVELEGVVRIGAVNCDDTFHLCSWQGIRSYPSIMTYPGRIKYGGNLQKEDIIKYAINKIGYHHIFDLGVKDWKKVATSCGKPWVVYKSHESQVYDEDAKIKKAKMGALLRDLTCFGEINCHLDAELCSRNLGSLSVFLSGSDLVDNKAALNLDMDSNAQEVAKQILAILPNIKNINRGAYRKIIKSHLEKTEYKSYLIIFHGDDAGEYVELRKLPPLLPSLEIRQASCEDLSTECDELYISKTPSFIVFKPGGGYEIYQGRLLAHDIAVFAKESAQSRFFRVLTPKTFPSVLDDNKPWFIDFYAPWCPPCMRLLPEFRKASRLVKENINFGTIDCTTHTDLCRQYNINQYPSTILYNQSYPHQYHGQHTASSLADFVKDTLKPVVINLDGDSYKQKITSRSKGHMLVVNFYASFCHHCHEMAPEYRKFARLVSSNDKIHAAQIDCEKYRSTCSEAGIHAYPTIKAFITNFEGELSVVSYKAWNRNAESFRQWASSHLPSKALPLNHRTFEELVLKGAGPFLVDFYDPRCGPCIAFDPIFKEVAEELEGLVTAGQMDCDIFSWFCSRAQVFAFPTVKLYLGTEKTGVKRQDEKGGVQLDNLDKMDLIQTVKKLIARKGASRPNKDEL